MPGRLTLLPPLQRYRIENGGDTVKIALNVDSTTQTLCRTDLNAEAYVSSNTGSGNIRQFTLTSKSHVKIFAGL